MAEHWKGIAAEVEDALRSIADVNEPSKQSATIRKDPNGPPPQPWDPPGGTPTYHKVIVLVSDKELRDINGTLIGQTKRTITVSGAAGVVPSDDDKIILGQALEYGDAETDATLAWEEIMAVRALAPAGVAVLYDLDLGA
jgi:hypothetical protein